MPTLAPTPHPHALTSPESLDLLDGEIRRIADLAAGSFPGTAVPGLPGWDVAALLQHLTTTHRWVERMVAQLSERRLDKRPFDLAAPADWTEAVDAFRACGARLVATMRAADPDAAMYSWADDERVGFWIRRMLHETTIHRTDAERAAETASRIEPAVAVDAIDEFLSILPHAALFRPQVRHLHGDGETIHLHATDLAATDLPGEWLITLEPTGYRWSHAHVKGAVAVRGGATELALFVYGRLAATDPALEVLGETPLLTHWTAKSML